MGQVPKKTYGIVGSGKTAKHIKYYFQCLNILIKSWARSENLKSPADTLADCNIILLLIKDSEIEVFIEQNPFLKEKTVVHFSGSLVLPNIQSAHPLMTFGNNLYSIDLYKRMSFVCEAGKESFFSLFPELPNPNYEIKSELKPYYHSLCVLSGNFTTLLWQKFFDDLTNKLNLPVEAAIPYLEKIIENIKSNPKNALTGPLLRRDRATISKNLNALDGDSFQKVYKSFVEVYDPSLLENIHNEAKP